MLTDTPQKWMQEALAEARKAFDLGEVPVGAVLVKGNQIIARAHNEVELQRDATAHAEMLAIRRASEALGSWRLSGSSLFVTLEPCSMCIGACLLSRVSEIYFGCYDPVQGAVGSVFDLSNHPGLPQGVNVYSEILKEEAQLLLQDFFGRKRASKDRRSTCRDGA